MDKIYKDTRSLQDFNMITIMEHFLVLYFFLCLFILHSTDTNYRPSNSKLYSYWLAFYSLDVLLTN